MKIGIIIPLWCEFQPFLTHQPQYSLTTASKRRWIQMRWGSHELTFVVSKPGARNTTKYTRLLIEKHTPDLIINFGTAASLVDHLNVGQLVALQSVYETQTDFHAQSSHTLCSQATQHPAILLGNGVTVQEIISDAQTRQQLNTHANAIVGDWESAWFLKCAQEFDIPALGLRMVSDQGQGEVLDDFNDAVENHLPHASKVVLDILETFRL